MLNILNIILILVTLGVPFIALTRQSRRLCPAVVSLLSCGLFLLLQIVTILLFAKEEHTVLLQNTSISFFRSSALLFVAALLLNGQYLLVLRRESEEKMPAHGRFGHGLQFLTMVGILMVVFVPPMIFCKISPEAADYTGHALARKTLPGAWCFTAAAMLLLILLTGLRNLSGATLGAIVLSLLMIMFGAPILPWVYEMDEFYRAMVLGYLLPLALILLLLLVFSRRNNTVFLAVTLVLFLGVMLLVSPYTYDVNSKQNCYAYNEGVQEYLDIHLVTIRGIYVQRIFDTSHFSGEWKISGFTDGFEPITIYSPDDRPYKNVTRYDENGEKLRQASFQFFGNSRFTDYVLLVGQVVGWEADWDPANGSILCSNAETYNEMTACAARHNIGYLDPIETEVVP